MRLLPLIAATYFMVSGGPYGLEDIIGKAGYGRALLLLALVPLVWSLPTSLMVGELASAMPEEGGYYCWVRRALGGFWGFQEAWLSLAASVFDMAIYPILFVTYLGFLGKYTAPAFGAADLKGAPGFLLGTGMIAVCALANLPTPRNVGRSALLLTFALLAPFAVLTVLAVARPAAPAPPAERPAALDSV